MNLILIILLFIGFVGLMVFVDLFHYKEHEFTVRERIKMENERNIKMNWIWEGKRR